MTASKRLVFLSACVPSVQIETRVWFDVVPLQVKPKLLPPYSRIPFKQGREVNPLRPQKYTRIGKSLHILFGRNDPARGLGHRHRRHTIVSDSGLGARRAPLSPVTVRTGPVILPSAYFRSKRPFLEPKKVSNSVDLKANSKCFPAFCDIIERSLADSAYSRRSH
jgi:hypothetical protein